MTGVTGKNCKPEPSEVLMPPSQFDTIVVGLGVMGSSITRELARRGQRVLGVDRERPPHVHGSSHGHSRVTREVYGDDKRYVPFVQRTNQCWRELQEATGTQLLIESGLVLMGTPDSALIQDTEASSREHNLPCDPLEHEAISRRWPQLQCDPDMCGLWDGSAGILRVEPCIETLLAQAEANGATLHCTAAAETWQAAEDHVTVQTATESWQARQLVIAAGPWLGTLLSDLDLPLQCERHVQYWFEPKSNPERFAPGNCPIYTWQYGNDIIYGFPDLGHGIKIARHHTKEFVQPDTVNRDINDRELDEVRSLLERFIPTANGRLIAHDVCMYTNTPDYNFIIDFHPDHSNVLIVGGCSGHGFKFGPVVGELSADLLQGIRDPGLEMFQIDRLIN